MFDRQLKECDAKGICENVENLEDFGEIKIKKPSISIVVIKSEGKIVIRKNEPWRIDEIFNVDCILCNSLGRNILPS